MQSCKLICFGFRKHKQTRCNNPKAERRKLRTFAVPNGCNMNKTKHKRGFDLLYKGTKNTWETRMFCQLFSLQNKYFLCLQHIENKGFQTVIKHRLKAIQKHIKNELGNREKNTKNAHFVLKKCTFRFRDYNLSYREDTYMTLMLFCGSSPKILN